MTDNEIIKALGCVAGYGTDCESCPNNHISHPDCMGRAALNALDLINCQRAEIERLQRQLNNAEELVNEKTVSITDLHGENEKFKVEAIKEFAERLKKEADSSKIISIDGNWAVSQAMIDNFVKETVGDAE